MRLVIVLVLLAAAALMVRSATPPDKPPSTAALWEEVRKANGAGLPKTALEKVETILRRELAARNWAGWLLALSEKISLETTIQGNRPEEKVARLRAVTPQAPAEVRAILKTVLAEWYWQYYSRNRWRFLNRSQTAGGTSDDFTTWDLPRIFREIDTLYTEALADAPQLKKSPVKELHGFLDDGTLGGSFRPTLYDFAAFQALEFYTSAEQAKAAPENAFELDASSPAFAPRDEFLAWKPESADKASPSFKAVRLYQDLLAFHRTDADPTARVDADLHRLRWVKNEGFGEGRNAVYIARLEALQGECRANGRCPEAGARVARWLADGWLEAADLVKALQVAEQAAKEYPGTLGASACQALAARIQARTANLLVERCLPPKAYAAEIRYKNVTTLHLRAVRDDWKAFMGRKWGHPAEVPSEERVWELLRSKPEKQWTVQLPPTPDYQERTAKVDVPALPPGFYRFFLCSDPDFNDRSMLLQNAGVWVSPLTLVTRSGRAGADGFVLDIVSGEPVPDAAVTLYSRLNEYYKQVFTIRTDADGHFQLPDSFGYDTHVHVKKGEAELFDVNGVNPPPRYPNPPVDQAVFFTDRSLYRPGQTVQFKAILVNVDDEKRNYQVLPRRTVNVVLRDPNGQEAGRLQLTSNDFGSVTGVFPIPAGRLTGVMSLSAENCRGAGSFRVEEYKRPKFLVEVEKPKVPSRLGDEVAVTGKATGYTGAAVDGASVRYRVVRLTRYPYWWEWYHGGGPQSNQSQEIAHGRTETGPDGSFTVRFFAKPDPSVPESSDPTFLFQVYADVTDAAGETRSDATTVTLGYAALALNLSAADSLTAGTPFPVRIAAQTLDGDPLEAEGTLTIWSLVQPAAPVRSPLAPQYGPAAGAGPEVWQRWPLGDKVKELPFYAKAGSASLDCALPEGFYRLEAVSRDAHGRPVHTFYPLMVLPGWDARRCGLKVPSVVKYRAGMLTVGEELDLVWGTGYAEGRSVLELLRDGVVLERSWSEPGTTMRRVRRTVPEDWRGGFTVRLTYVRENRNYTSVHSFFVPWDNKELQLSFESFRDKTEPGAREKAVVRIKGKTAAVAAAEMAAALYDASLDQFCPHGWPGFNFFHYGADPGWTNFVNAMQNVSQVRNVWSQLPGEPEASYARFPSSVTESLFLYAYNRRMMAMPAGAMKAKGGRNGGDQPEGAPPPPVPAMVDSAAEPSPLKEEERGGGAKSNLAATADQSAVGGVAADKAALDNVKARENLSETAFFLPCLTMDPDGSVAMEYTMPEALTQWKFLGFAHTSDCRFGLLTGQTVTRKELMVQPNAPRFLREGDEIEFTVKVVSVSEGKLSGVVRLEFLDLLTGRPAGEALGLADAERTFDLEAASSASFSWRIKVPVGQGPLQYVVKAVSGRLSDGEAGPVPVLSGRVFVTESVPLWVRGPEKRAFNFARLAEIGKPGGPEPFSLTVQMASNPAWYAVQALPFLMEYPYECSEQVFHRLFANALARRIAVSDPRIRQIFDAWRGTDALKSNLQKNQDLKSVLLEETPWVLEAKSEETAKRNVGLLFDANVVESNVGSAMEKLKNMQLSNGAWPWFPGGRPAPWITLVVASGFGKLRHFGAEIDVSMAVRALDYLDGWLDECYREIPANVRAANHLTPMVAAWLHMRSFFLKDQPVSGKAKTALAYFLGQARQYWLRLDSRLSQGQLAIALKRFGDALTAGKIVASLKERSVSDPELGMFWREQELSWWWWRAPIETQAVMIEALGEVAGDAKSVEDCQVWLLKQKQTQAWKTTTGTAEAVYALLVQGANLLSDSEPVAVRLGGETVQPGKIEPGTGFYEVRYAGSEVKPACSAIEVEKKTPGIAWGGVHFQYFQDLSAVGAHETNLKLEKALFVQRDTVRGPVIEPVAGPLKVGDLVTVRVTLRTDRDMEYVHLKDGRGSGLEPTSVLSGYRFQDGLAYYQSTRDTATHFFIDYLPKGTYVFEYTLRVQLRGRYPSGLAEIQCMYAPEFNSHSASVPMVVE